MKDFRAKDRNLYTYMYIYIHTYIHTYIHIQNVYIYICAYIERCVCVFQYSRCLKIVGVCTNMITNLISG